MARKTIYCAQAFWLRGGRPRGGEVHQFLNEERAREGGRALLSASDGVAVFSVEGHIDEGLWEEPCLIETFGSVPPLHTDPWLDHVA